MMVPGGLIRAAGLSVGVMVMGVRPAMIVRRPVGMHGHRGS